MVGSGDTDWRWLSYVVRREFASCGGILHMEGQVILGSGLVWQWLLWTIRKGVVLGRPRESNCVTGSSGGLVCGAW